MAEALRSINAMEYRSAELVQYDINRDLFEKDTGYIVTQLNTHLKERFNVLVSTVEYGIVGGHLVRQGTAEPFVDSIKRGRDYIQSFGYDSDHDRENAEVDGFEFRTDPFLANPDTPLWSKVLSISLPGEKYEHNFYDIFTLKRKNGQRYVELSRYSSALEAGDYAKLLPGLDPENPPTAAEFLANPIIISNPFVSADQIHQAFHRDHDYMNLAEFEEIWTSRAVQDRVSAYLFRKDGRTFNAILNAADAVWEENKKKKAGLYHKDYSLHAPTAQQIKDWEEQEVRQAAGGCPGKSGAKTSSSPWGVADYSGDKAREDPNLCHCAEGDGPHFHCPGEKEVAGEDGEVKKVACKAAIIVGNGISSCPDCGEGKKC